MKKPKTIYNKGFTLIELLVVIGIISILSAVVLSSLTQAKAQADNTKQIADYRVVLNALLQFKQDNGYYPTNTIGDTCIGIYSNGGCIKINSTVPNNTDMNNSLKKYLSSYSFVDKPVVVATGGPSPTSTYYKGFIFSCTGLNEFQCNKGRLFFPALKKANACPKIMSDISSGEFLSVISDYTWCQVDLN